MKKLIIFFLILCASQDQGISQGSSIAKHWNEFTLDAIRNDLARPTVHARNLFHLSVLMYDAWAAYDAQAQPYMLGQNLYGYQCTFTGVPVPANVQAAREEAISHAAFNFLRIFNLLVDLQNEMVSLGYNPFNNSTNYASGDPAALGNYLASCMNQYAITDGANQTSNYGNNYYSPVNPPMDLTLPGNSTLVDFDRWQPLAFQIFIDQSGNPIPGGTPPFLSPEWGNVNPFAFTAADRVTYNRNGDDYNVYCDPGPPPLMTDQADDDYKWGFSMVSIWGSPLDPDDGVMIDISPGALGNLPTSSYPTNYTDYRTFYDYTNGGVIGANGHSLNPITSAPYQPNIVKRGDYTRILAEFWADGPDSETPPGHWFAILNYVLDHPQFTRDYRGVTPLSQLEYDVKAYFLLGGAMHDAAITAWGIKGWYDYIRPVSAIRGMAEAGQSSDATLPNYSTDGIPLVANYIELVQAGDPLAGANNENVNKIKLYTWRGHDFIIDPLTDYAGVGWILAEDWFPYQRPTFVTPNFAGYISGHSTYSRAAAEVLTTLTGDEFFPGGIGAFNTVQNQFLVFEEGPSEDVTLQWATYRDASDQTSLSRIWGGIHPPADDIPGRECGIQIAEKVFNVAEEYFFPPMLAVDISCPVDVTGTTTYDTTGELPVYPIGESTITYTVTDPMDGSTAACTFTVTVEDNEAPLAVCQDLTLALDANGSAMITADMLDNASTDNCSSSLTFDASQTMFTCSDVGSVAVTLSVTDEEGNIGTCISNVTIEDNTAPAVGCLSLTVELDSNGEAIITSDMLNDGSTDNCTSALIFDASQTTFTCMDVGVVPVTLTVTDEAGNTNSCIANITVQDNLSPTAVCQDITVELDPNGVATITADMLDNGSVDNCSTALTFDASQLDFTCADLVVGVIPVTLTVTDEAGNTSTCISNVSIEDLEAPVVICQDITIQLDENGEAIITADMLDGGSSDNCTTALTFSASQTVFGCGDIALGATACSTVIPVTLTVTDDNGNAETCIANVALEDNIAPIFDCPLTQVIQLGPSECGINYSFVELPLDNCGNTPTITQISGPELGEFLSYTESPYNYEFSITDDCGNVTDCAFQIELVQYVPVSGTLACNDNLTISRDQNCEVLITAEMLLEGSDYPCTGDYLISSAQGGQPVASSFGSGTSLLFTASDEAGTYAVNITDPHTGISCWTNVILEDKIDPILACDCETPYLADGVTPNPDCSFLCHEIWDLEILEEPGRNNELLPDADELLPADNCIDFGFPIINLSYSQGNNCGEQIVSRELLWTYVDHTGTLQYLSCTQNYLFDNLDIGLIGSTSNGAWDNYPDIFTANSGDRPVQNIYTPEPIVYLPCGADTSPEGIALIYDIDTPGRPTGIDRDDHSQTPNIVEHNEGYVYGYPYVVQAGWAGRYHAKPIDNNVCNIYSVFTDLTYDTCADDCYGNSKVARSWTILDWCNASTVEFVQTIKRIDQEGPAVSGPDVTISVDPWSCTADYLVPAPEHLLDNCDKNPTWSVVTPVGVTFQNGYLLGLEKGVHQYSYEASDCCGNLTYYTVNVLVEDRVAPTAIALQNIVIQLTSIEDQDAIAKLWAVDVDNESHDGCTDVHFEIRRDGNDWCNPGSNATFNNDGHEGDGVDDTDDGAFVKFCCEDAIDIDENGVLFGLHNVVLRVWDDGDMDGVFGSAGDNYNETWTTVRVEDKLGATVVCPSHIELSCNEDYLDYDLTGRPYGFKACSDVVCDGEPSDNFRKKPTNSPPFAGEEIPAYNPTCRRGAIQRTWNCEGKTCTQWIIMRDTEDGPLEITWPEDQVGDCQVMETEEPQIVERLCELTGTSLQSDTFNFEDGACFKILNHWTVINWCDYDADDSDLNDSVEDQDDGFIPGYYTHTQVIKFLDTEKPTLTLADTCFAVNSDCIGDNLSIYASAADNGICASEWIKWNVEVDMYSDWEVDYTYSSFLPSDDDFYVAPSGGDNNETIHIDLPDGLPNGCSSRHRVRWTAQDGCGNETSGTSFFTIEDKKKPTPYMLNLSTALMENGQVELWASDFNAGSFDNCSQEDYLYYTFSSHVPYQLIDPSEEDPWYDMDGPASQNDYNNGNAEAWNNATGSSAMIFNQDDLAIQESNGGVLPLSIYVWDQCGNYDHAIVNLKLVDNGGDASANIGGRVATEMGEGIPEVMMTASGVSIDYDLNVLTYDQGNYLFDYNPMQEDYLISASKNDDWLNGVSTLDLVFIQRHILGLQSLGSPYKMIAADASNDQRITAIDLIQLRKLILGVYTELPDNDSWRFTIDLVDNMTTEDFIGIKIGDVNDSVSMFHEPEAQTRMDKDLKLKIEETALEGGLTELSFSSDNFNNIFGFQFALKANIGEVIRITSNNLNLETSHFHYNSSGIVFSWNSDSELSLPKGMLFKLLVKKNSQTPISINTKQLNAEAYQGNGLDVIGLDLEIDPLLSHLSQNEPNPWTNETVIKYSLKTDEMGTLRIFDITGKTLFKLTGLLGEGTISVSASELGLESGVLFYRLESKGFSETRKMVLIE